MNQFQKILQSLSLKQRFSILAVALLAGVGLWSFAHWKTESDFRQLYSGMAPADAGAVLQKLKESGVEYRLADNGTAVLVPSARVAELRLDLAAAGLPKSGRMGFELFDKNSFGATDFVEHVNYSRALEGELERSVGCLAEVEQARVHITFPKDSVFLDSRQPAKASVMVRLKPGGRLAPQSVNAVRQLIASAVENLSPDAVAVLDMDGNLLSRARVHTGDNATEPDDLLEFRHQIERDLVAKMNATLEPLLGADRFRAGASVDCDFTSGEQSEETYDPNKSVMVTSQTTEDVSGPGGSAGGGIPGSASNLPNPAPRTAGRSGNSVSRKTESITYQSSRVVKHTRVPQGIVKKISLSVLLDQPGRWEGQGAARHRVLTPATPETLQAIRSLVTAATGLSTERGDLITIESLPFESPAEPVSVPPPAARPVASSPLPRQLVRPLLIGGIVLGFALLALCVRLLRGGKRRNTAAATEQPMALPAPAGTADAPVIAGQAPPTALEPAEDAESGPRRDDLLKAAREAFQRDPVASATVLRRWIQERQPS